MKITAAHEFHGQIPQSISPEIFQELLMAGRIVDGRAGGMVLGKYHEEGSAHVLFKIGSEYIIQGRVEGGEFVLNWEAAAINMARINAMNAGLTLKEIVVDDPHADCSQLIMAIGWPHDRMIWLDWGQTSVNREAAAKHAVELCEMNRSPNRYLQCDLFETFGMQGTADGIV